MFQEGLTKSAFCCFTVSYPGGRNKQISLSAEQKPLVQQWLRNYQKLKATLERICELNHKMLRPESHR